MDETKLGLHPDTAAIRKLAAKRGITSAAAAQLLRAQEPTSDLRPPTSDLLTLDDVEIEIVPAPAD